MADCFCGCGRSVKSLGHVARANRLGRKLIEAVPLSAAAVERFPQICDDECRGLAADGPRRLAQVKGYVHGELPRELLDADGINQWFAAWRQQYGRLMKEGTDGWTGINPLSLMQLLLMGERATATIVDIRDTGMTLNDDPRVEIVFQFTPEGGGAPIRRSTKKIVSRVAIPQRGSQVALAYDPHDDTRLSFRGDILPEGPVAAATPAAVPAADLAKPALAEDADPIARLERLAALHASGALTDDEFKAAKQQILRG